MAKPNFQFQKRQKELAKKEKKELKKQKKLEQKSDELDIHQESSPPEPLEPA